jgi:two-component system cell cycle response regulator DivK
MAQTSILYIEDNPENRLLVRRTLEASGYALTEAVDGPSGLRAAQESCPDLILLDISLPEMDGYDLARRFAGFEHLEHVPVLAVTANVMKGDKERALSAGCDGYIPKPIDIDQLPRQVEEALRSALRRHSEPAQEPAPGVVGADATGKADEAHRESAGGGRGDPAQFTESGPLPDASPAGITERRSPVRSQQDASRGTVSGHTMSRRDDDSEPAPPARPSGASRDQSRDSEHVDEPAQIATEDSGQAVPPEVRVPVRQVRQAEERGGEDQTDAPMVAFSLDQACHDFVIDEMENLIEELGATAIVLAQDSCVVAEVGGPDGWRPEELAALAAQGFRASDSVASLLGCGGGCRELITDSGTMLLHAVAVDGDLVLMAAMPASVPLGAARLYVRRAARRVSQKVRRGV